MTLFEYVTVAISIVLALGVMRLLDGLRFAVLPERRYWTHFLWIATKLLNHALYWWGMWALRDLFSWNFGSFLWVLLFPAALYLQSTSLVTTNPSEITSWRDHFYSIRRWFFAINILLVPYAATTTAVLLGVPLFHVSRVPLALVLVLNVLGVVSARPRLHLAIAVIVFLAQVLGFGNAQHRYRRDITVTLKLSHVRSA